MTKPSVNRASNPSTPATSVYLIPFVLVCLTLIGAALRFYHLDYLGIFCALVWAGFYDLVVYPIGIIVAFAWNFYINRIVTWRKPT